jgi:transcriptional pleiotropic regulator of transition state genes
LLQFTGIIRQIDDLGRLVIPAELRHMLGIATGTGVEMYMADTSIFLERYVPGCLFCGKTEGLQGYRGKWMCRECLELIEQRVP